MRTLVGDPPDADGDGIAPPPDADDVAAPQPSIEDLDRSTPTSPPPAPTTRPGGGNDRQRHLPSIAPDPTPGHRRSRFDADLGTVLYNEQHADFLSVKDDETALLDYLATLVAKEYVVYNNPRADTEELVRMLIRVRRRRPRRR
jgi:hypothetical protein